MDQQTCDIIMCCKGYGKGNNPKEKIINYMAKMCCCDRTCYNDETVFTILKESVYDYIDKCSKPRTFMYNMLENIRTYVYSPILKNNNYTPIDSIVSAFRAIQVRNEKEYINGFTQELIDQSDINLGVKNE